MPEAKTHVLVVAPAGSPNLLGSYGRALESLGARVSYWDLDAAMSRSVKLGRLGRRLNAHLHLEAWESDASRALIVEARRLKPDAIFIGGSTRVVPGALAQVAVALPSVRLVLVWPDTLLNLAEHVIAALPLYDLVATYGESSIPVLRRLGAREAIWVPFAADTKLFPASVSINASQREEFSCDVSFIGNHRPERERAIVALLDAGLNVKVWGGKTWLQRSANPKRAQTYWQRRELIGQDFVRAVQCSKVSLNVVDDTNFPSANMRFFEALACRGCALVSSTPEMVAAFPDGIAVAYYDGEKQLVEKARELLADAGLRERLTKDGHHRVMDAHTYAHRATHVMKAIELPLG